MKDVLQEPQVQLNMLHLKNVKLIANLLIQAQKVQAQVNLNMDGHVMGQIQETLIVNKFYYLLYTLHMLLKKNVLLTVTHSMELIATHLLASV